MADPTAYRYVSNGKRLFDSEIRNHVLLANRKALHIRPNTHELDLAYKNAKRPEFEGVQMLKTKIDRPFVFDPAL